MERRCAGHLPFAPSCVIQSPLLPALRLASMGPIRRLPCLSWFPVWTMRHEKEPGQGTDFPRLLPVAFINEMEVNIPFHLAALSSCPHKWSSPCLLRTLGGTCSLLTRTMGYGSIPVVSPVHIFVLGFQDSDECINNTLGRWTQMWARQENFWK